MSSTTPALSPIIDTGRMGMVTVANRIDNIDSSSDVFQLQILYHQLKMKVITMLLSILLNKLI